MATTQEQQYARRTARGTILYHLYRMQDLGLNDPATPARATRIAIQAGLGATGMLPPPELECSSLRWLEQSGYVTVDWAMDDQRSYESAEITLKGLNLCESKTARQDEQGLNLPPRR